MDIYSLYISKCCHVVLEQANIRRRGAIWQTMYPTQDYQGLVRSLKDKPGLRIRIPLSDAGGWGRAIQHLGVRQLLSLFAGSRASSGPDGRVTEFGVQCKLWLFLLKLRLSLRFRGNVSSPYA